MNRDVGLEIRQLVERGFGHYERGQVYDALAEWESVLRLDPWHVQAGRLVEFCRVRAREMETVEHREPLARDTTESPIPQFLAALTERKSDAAPHSPSNPWANLAVSETFDGRETLIPQSSEFHQFSFTGVRLPPPGIDLNETWVPDTEEDLPVDMEALRASARQLVSECRAALDEKREGAAALAAELVLELGERAPPPGVDDVLLPSMTLFEQAFRAFIGDPLGCPIRAIPTAKLSDLGFDQRAESLMGRMDAMTSLTELMDNSAISPFDALRLLAALCRAKAIDLLPPIG